MTIFEAGGGLGAPAGAAIGGIALKSHGLLAMALGSVVGFVSGFVLGCLYGLLVLSLTHVFHLGWCAAKNQPQADVPGPAWTTMRRIGKLGVSIGVLGALTGWLTYGWREAVLVTIAVGVVTGMAAGFRSGV